MPGMTWRFGNALKEIRDEELYAEAGFETWDAYLKDRVGEEFGIEQAQAFRLMQAATIRPKLPDPTTFYPKGENAVDAEWKPSVVKEFARLAPEDKTKHGHPRDLQSLRKQDVQRACNIVQGSLHCGRQSGRAELTEQCPQPL